MVCFYGIYTKHCDHDSSNEMFCHFSAADCFSLFVCNCAGCEGPLATPTAKVAAADALRHRDQEERNEGLLQEMSRQRIMFKLAFYAAAKAKGELTAMEGKVAALEALLKADQGQQVKISGQVRDVVMGLVGLYKK